jgi:hypothetical protein
MIGWPRDHCLAQTKRYEKIKSVAYERLRSLRIEPPAPARLDCLFHSALCAFGQRFCATVHGRLSSALQQRREALLRTVEENDAEEEYVSILGRARAFWPKPPIFCTKKGAFFTPFT